MTFPQEGTFTSCHFLPQEMFGVGILQELREWPSEPNPRALLLLVACAVHNVWSKLFGIKAKHRKFM